MEDMRIIRKKDLFNLIGISESTIYRLEKNGKFPKRIKISDGLVGWIYRDIINWLDDKKNKNE